MEDVVVYGLLRGGVYALAALGFSLVLGVVGIVNFAHGAMVVFGGLLANYLVSQLAVPYLIAVVLSILGTGILALVVQRIFITRTFRLEPLMVLVQTFGIATVITELATLGWGSEERVLRITTGLPAGFELGPTFVPTLDLIIFLVSIGSASLLFYVMAKTEFGRAIRACSDNRESAQLNGINLKATFDKTMLLAGMWAGLAGALFVTLSPVAPYMHFNWTVDSFLVITIGGLGSMLGAMLGGLIFGILSFAAAFYLPTIAPAVTFGVLLLFLLFRPQGLLGAGSATRK